ncbi:hypothetical protein BCR35DRAFT_63241 [Leucosporidium creatinivorum]|uniref:F-box domain-containing protein n=1 Tax=Leucosporidium creatinivorum TaxID=106004 RepID=A0A1Y2FHQ0_9BASI|nr:hypothetical protein BCR35DRAFT_63241 [Leucosporidium creatinivorum]
MVTNTPAAARPSLITLPPELLLPIVEHALPPPALRSFSQRSSILRELASVQSSVTAIAQSGLLAHVQLGPPERDARTTRLLAAEQGGKLSASKIKSVSLQSGAGASEEVVELVRRCTSVEEVWWGDATHEEDALFAALAELPNLKSLHLSECWFDLPSAPFAFNSLTHLTIAVGDPEGLNTDLLRPYHFPSLHSITISLYNWSEVEDLESAVSLLAPQLRTLSLLDEEGFQENWRMKEVLPKLSSLHCLELKDPAADLLQAISAIPSPLRTLRLDAQSAGKLLEVGILPACLEQLKSLALFNPSEMRTTSIEEWSARRGVRLESWDGGEGDHWVG